VQRAMGEVVRTRMAGLTGTHEEDERRHDQGPFTRQSSSSTPPLPPPAGPDTAETPLVSQETGKAEMGPASAAQSPAQGPSLFDKYAEPVQIELDGTERPGQVEPGPMYSPVSSVADAPMQLFDTYLLVPEDDRLLIIDQHALHERLTYDNLRAEIVDHEYAAQQLAVPLLIEVAPSQVELVESNIELFSKLGIEMEPFGDTTFQVTSLCHLYDESRVPDIVYRVLDALGQGELFDRDEAVSDMLRLTVEACRGSVKAGDRLSPLERRQLLDGFRRLKPPYTCPHGRPIITELAMTQMEKSFRRRQ